jgi:hypothetical protein
MLVKTPAIKLGVEIRASKMDGERIALTGVAGAMPCSVELTPHEALGLARQMLRWPILKALLGALFTRQGGA